MSIDEENAFCYSTTKKIRKEQDNEQQEMNVGQLNTIAVVA